MQRTFQLNTDNYPSNIYNTAITKAGENVYIIIYKDLVHLVPTRSEGRAVLGAGSIPVAILPSCQEMMKTIALKWI